MNLFLHVGVSNLLLLPPPHPNVFFQHPILKCRLYVLSLELVTNFHTQTKQHVQLQIHISLFHCCTMHIASIHIYFNNTCTCESQNISVDTLNIKNKPLKLLELQHVSVFHKTILSEPFVPVLKSLIVHYYISKYAGSMSYFICDGFGFHVPSFHIFIQEKGRQY